MLLGVGCGVRREAGLCAWGKVCVWEGVPNA